MRIEIDGVPVNVPDRWDKTYTQDQKDTVIRWVRKLKEAYGEWLNTVYILRLVPRGDTGKKFRIDGGYSTDTVASREAARARA